MQLHVQRTYLHKMIVEGETEEKSLYSKVELN